MAITKLMHFKESKQGLPSFHLQNAIKYILNPEKTQDGALVGGNVGIDYQSIYQAMMDTKEDFEKLHGRQGYHFVLSWKPGEIDLGKAEEVIRDFCQEYLQEEYDFVYAMHNDHDHVHGHIIFNSVNRVNGYKYRYEKGDWEKYIQPVTDRVCQKHGVPALQFEEERKGLSYAEWTAEKEGKKSWKDIILADLDYVIASCQTEEAFFQGMKEQGYQIRKGNSKKHGTYYSLKAPGQKRAWRSYHLGKGYSFEDVLRRMTEEKKELPVLYPRKKLMKANTNVTTYQRKAKMLTGLPVQTYRKMYLIRFRRWQAPVPTISKRDLRKSLLHIDKFQDDLSYMIKNRISSMKDLKEREASLRFREKEIKNQYFQKTITEENELIQEYQFLEKQLAKIPVWDESFEEILDRMEELEPQLPKGIYQEKEKQSELKLQLDSIQEEKKIIRHIRREVEDTKLHPVRWNRQELLQKKQTIQKKENVSPWYETSRVPVGER